MSWWGGRERQRDRKTERDRERDRQRDRQTDTDRELSLIHISEPTRQTSISYAVFCLKKIFF